MRCRPLLLSLGALLFAGNAAWTWMSSPRASVRAAARDSSVQRGDSAEASRTRAAIALADATPPAIGTTKSFAVLAGKSVVNTGNTVLNSDLGTYPGATANGFPPGMVFPPGAKHLNDGVAQQAQADAVAAYNALVAMPCGTTLTGKDLGGMTLTPGIYCFAAGAQCSGALVLDAQGDANALFVFKIGSTLTTAANASVSIVNGGTGCNPNVFWQVGDSATLGSATTLRGTVLAMRDITLGAGATVSGRLLARNGTVSLDTNNVTIPPACGSAPVGDASSGAGK